jgi:glutamine amidotransferase
MIAIIDYNAGNIRSVQNALNRMGCDSMITDDVQQIRAADKVILPGVGEASSAMHYLRDKGLDKVIQSLTQPLMGICLGLQLLCDFSEEGDTTCLGVFPTIVRRFPPMERVPHIGWNDFTKVDGPLLRDTSVEDDVYYVHSYYAEVCDYTTAVCDYILPFSAAIAKDNFMATQFHPEKSAHVGQAILQNFINI